VTEAPVEDESGERPDARAQRIAKLDAVRQRGLEPYPYRFDRTHTAAEVREAHAELPPGTETDHAVAVAGRVMLIRRQGKLIFATLRDRTGELQLFVSRAVVGDDAFAAFDDLDLGDWIGAHGVVMTTRRGELSVKIARFELLAKALRPLPDKWKGLSDVDTRFRQRYADLIVNEEARRVFTVRHRLVASFRRTLDELGFVEVETPVLHSEAGGAHARPFQTYHHALDQEMYLRIALELHLKRLIVGGLERVYEIGRVFRNEGLSPRHNPEFTMLELYQAFADYTDVMAITEELIRRAAVDAAGSSVVSVGGVEIDLAQSWPRRDLLDLVEEHTGLRVHPSMDGATLRDILDSRGVDHEPWMGPGALCFELYDKLVERDLMGPVLVTRYPVEVSPLARADRDDPSLTERFELVVNGRELANGYSELNDPVVQRQRFAAEQRLREAGNLEAGSVDEDYLRALEYGMPPTGGLGIGIDRLAMLLAGVGSIREVILFPTLRPEQGRDASG
jgi:lysyl-tRNA synthetase class 2